MKKKMLIVSSAIVLLAALSTAAVLYVSQLRSFDPMSTPDSPVATTPDLSRSFGACDLVPKSTIQSALGDVARELQGPDDMGRIYSSGGVESQTCVYSFVPGGTIDNSFNSANGFSVEVFMYRDQTARDDTKALLLADATKDVSSVTGVGDSALFAAYTRSIESPDTTVATQVVTVYALHVYRSNSQYSFTLSQPRADNGASFAAARAQDALTAIATAANYQ